MKTQDVPFAWVRKEVTFPGEVRHGNRGRKVKTVQEWLTFHRSPTAIDGEFGGATVLAVKDFQKSRGLRVSGVVDEKTFAAMVQPLFDVLAPIDTKQLSYPELVLAYALQHIKSHPREVGDENSGPWVRMYTEGNEGKGWPWCAGFVTFLLRQASTFSSFKMPIKGSSSCDTLAAQAKEVGRFVREGDLRSRALPQTACVFLVRRSPTDWIHTGLVRGFESEAFRTLEGNTNDSGSREGFEAVARVRGYAAKDFITLE